MSPKNPTPFDSLLGSYVFPATVSHNRVSQKSSLFVGDRWCEVGDIEYVFVATGPNAGFLAMQPPDVEAYAHDHQDEGTVDWFKWGPRVN